MHGKLALSSNLLCSCCPLLFCRPHVLWEKKKKTEFNLLHLLQTAAFCFAWGQKKWILEFTMMIEK